MNISAVIPAYNDQRSLDRTLASLFNQTTQLHEIIVVDDGSEPPIRVPAGVELLRIERQPSYRGSSRAKNAGAEHATGDWLLFSDDDIVHAPDAVESVIRRINDIGRKDMLVNVLSVPFKDGKEIHQSPAYIKLIMNNKISSSEQHMGVISKNFFDSLGGYDSTSFMNWSYNNQDLSTRALKSGGFVTSNVRSVRTGELLYCLHTRPSNHDSVSAKRDFEKKHGMPFIPRSLHA